MNTDRFYALQAESIRRHERIRQFLCGVLICAGFVIAMAVVAGSGS